MRPQSFIVSWPGNGFLIIVPFHIEAFLFQSRVSMPGGEPYNSSRLGRENQRGSVSFDSRQINPYLVGLMSRPPSLREGGSAMRKYVRDREINKVLNLTSIAP